MREHKLSSLGNLLGGALSRHGIGERVAAAQIVASAKQLVAAWLPGVASDEIRVVSYKHGELQLTCKSPAARHAVEGLAKKLCRQLEADYPDQTFKAVSCRLGVGQANDEQWYNGLTV